MVIFYLSKTLSFTDLLLILLLLAFALYLLNWSTKDEGHHRVMKVKGDDDTEDLDELESEVDELLKKLEHINQAALKDSKKRK